jgi:pimeloyl-ACP methyl ester carboxylesterase
MTDDTSDRPTEGFVALRDRRVAATFLGEGTPLVLLETGFGADAGSWTTVAAAISRLTRVCYYDRAGRGRSEPAEAPRRPEALLADVHQLVRSPGASLPFVYVGQSFGGLLARLYAHRHPDDVAGVVLVDAMSEEQFEVCSPLLPPPFTGEPEQLTSMRSFWAGGWREPARNTERIDLVACQRAAREITSLGDVPLRVLTASTWTCPPRLPAEVGDRLQAVWDELQARFTGLSTRGARQTLAGCGHFVQTDRPQAVVDAIEAVVREVRSAG